MTAEEAANAMIEQVRLANEEALLASQALVFGKFDEYWQAKAADVSRRIEERYAAARPDPE